VGTSRTPAEFAGKLSRMTDGVARIPAVTARPNASRAETVVGGAVREMSGGDGRLSGAGPVGVNVATAGGRVTVDPAGPVYLVENDTRPHGHHPGTRGKGQWAKARAALVQPVAEDTAQAMTATTRRVFG
jgi:hypothetical protein